MGLPRNWKRRAIKRSMDKQTKSIYKRLREFAEENKCDSVMLIDGTIKPYMGERYLAIAIYKFKDEKFYVLE